MTNFQLCRFLPHEVVNGPLPSVAGDAGGGGDAAEQQGGLGDAQDDAGGGDDTAAEVGVVDVEDDDDDDDDKDEEDGLVVMRVGRADAPMGQGAETPAGGGRVTNAAAPPSDEDADPDDAESPADQRARLAAKDAAKAAAADAAADAVDAEYLRRFDESPHHLTLNGADRPFRCRNPSCLAGKCLRWSHENRNWVRPCGWGAKRGSRCVVEYSEVDWYTWMRWELKLRGKSRKTGEPVYAFEWVPHKGTRAEYMGELEARHTEFMPHVEAVRVDRQMKKLIEERLAVARDKTVMTDKSDYASDFETARWFNSTCVSKETHKMLVSASGYLSRYESRVVRKHGKRPEKVVTVAVQETDAWFGLFGGSEGDGSKASAQHYNMMREDKISFYKNGFTIHGEFFLNGERLPRRPAGWVAALPDATPAPPSIHLHDLYPEGCKMPKEGKPGEGEVWTLRVALLRDPLMPTMRHHMDDTDGCSAQVNAACFLCSWLIPIQH